MIPSSILPSEDLLKEKELYLKRKDVIQRLNDPQKFAKEAYLVTTLGYIISSPFGFSDNTSPLPSQEQRTAKILCENSTPNFIVPYVFYLPYVLKNNLCICLSSPVENSLISDPFTHEVLMAYLIDDIMREHNHIPTYRLYKTAYFCSGTGNIWKEEIDDFPVLNPELLFTLIDQMYTSLLFLQETLYFVSPLRLEDITYKKPYFQIGNYSRATCIIKTNKGMCLLDRERKKFTSVYLDEKPYYYYSEEELMPGSFSFYSLILSIVSHEELRNMFFSDERGHNLWLNLFRKQARKVKGRLNRKNLLFILEDIKLYCII